MSNRLGCVNHCSSLLAIGARSDSSIRLAVNTLEISDIPITAFPTTTIAHLNTKRKILVIDKLWLMTETSQNQLRSGNKWVQFLEIPEDLWKKIMQETLNGILVLLDSSKKLLSNNGNQAVCAGIYTYAIEEYGKLLLLKQCVPIDGKVKIEYRDGFRDHKAKFKVAIQNLPNSCINLCRIQPYEYEYRDIVYQDIIADFEARMAIFYSDFNSSGWIKSALPIETDRLKNAIEQLYIIAFAITFPN